MTLQPEKINTAKKNPFFKPTIQKKLSVGSANDTYETEADAMANKVMRMQEPQQNVSHTGALVQRKCTHCEQEEKLRMKPSAENISSLIQKSPTENGGESQAPSHVENQINSSRGGGSSMDHSTKSFMENRFGTDFSDVKIHTGSQAAQMSRELNAQAFTVGNDVYFNEGKYSPNTDSGKHLLAHELTHTVQQSSLIRRSMPKDIYGRPLGFFPTPEQEEYDRVTYEIQQWEETLERFNKGELDDNDLANYRLRNRLTGLASTEVTTLITKINDYKTKNPTISVSKIVEWLEVRKQISTPMPDGATVNIDPITQTITSYSLTVNNVKVNVVADTFGNQHNDTGPVTTFGRSYKWESKNNIITKLINNDTGANIDPTSFEVTIETRYDQSPDDPSAYGKGTDVYDKEEKTTTLRVHEGKHGTDYIDYIKNTPFPVDISKGIIGKISVAEMRRIDSYITQIGSLTCEATDQVGFSQDEFLKTAEGKRSGIKSCRTH